MTDHDRKVFGRAELAQRVCVVLGTRPGIIMLAPVVHALLSCGVPYFVIHTGQHYSPAMDSDLFRDLELPQPDHRLEGIAEQRTHGGQTGAMLQGIEQILLRERPRIALVGGDANTNLAGALAARKLGIEVGHVEAGERSYDWRMPEEHNRRMIDHISEYLFATATVARANLAREAVNGTVYVVGNTIVDASLRHLEIANRKSTALTAHRVEAGEFAIMTLHREENVDFEHHLRGALQGASNACKSLGIPGLVLAHPRTRKRIVEFGLQNWCEELPFLEVHEAVGYLDFLKMIANARLIFTDSGGVQQEGCIHGVPVVTLRSNTEWLETLEHGANRLAGTEPDAIVAAANEADAVARNWPVPFGDGSAAKRIVDIVSQHLKLSAQEASR